MLSEGLKEGGLWWNGLKKATKFLDSVMEKLLKQYITIPVVVLLDNIDADYHDWNRSEICSEFIDFVSGSYVATSEIAKQDWLSRYVEYQIDIPAPSPSELKQILTQRLQSLPFNYSNLVAIDSSMCELLIESCGTNLKLILQSCRESLCLHSELSAYSVEKIIKK
jgi:hypothetical protein